MPANSRPPQIIIITGPTAIGKSGLAHRLALEIGAEIINADSMQIYRYMDIGTAKPTPVQQQEVPYHLIDIVDPDSSFDASDFRDRAQKIIYELHDRHIPVLVVGGTGLYLRVLLRGLFNCPKPRREIREEWKRQAQGQGAEFLWEALKQRDPLSATRIHPNDTYRLIRALEVFELTGRPISEWQRWETAGVREFEALWVGLTLERSVLYDRINARVEAMMDMGFLEEVRVLLKRGYSPDLKSMKSLGYRHLLESLKGEKDLSTAVEEIKRDTRRYAKRQWTWLAKEENLNWFSLEEFDKVYNQIKDFLRTEK
ncbi:MAG TPA: tRNA (adenosine(37)-N6)-dimethylallyltransferase MiaA [Thermodesulfobacteriota bacterium]|nr:tRNA (adenosine(37)-N6)-dimethylallyltransferase MiaA [Thermodesulfobacteriota bacterium]